MYRTAIVPQASGRSAKQTAHDSLERALERWLADCHALRPGSGDRADLIDVEGAEHLRWVAAAGGSFASGALADAVAEDLDEITPEQIAWALRALLAPASAALRIRHDSPEARVSAPSSDRVSVS